MKEQVCATALCMLGLCRRLGALHGVWQWCFFGIRWPNKHAWARQVKWRAVTAGRPPPSNQSVLGCRVAAVCGRVGRGGSCVGVRGDRGCLHGHVEVGHVWGGPVRVRVRVRVRVCAWIKSYVHASV